MLIILKSALNCILPSINSLALNSYWKLSAVIYYQYNILKESAILFSKVASSEFKRNWKKKKPKPKENYDHKKKKKKERHEKEGTWAEADLWVRKIQLNSHWNLELFLEWFKWHLACLQHYRTKTTSFTLSVRKMFQQNGCACRWLAIITFMQGQSLFLKKFFAH